MLKYNNNKLFKRDHKQESAFQEKKSNKELKISSNIIMSKIVLKNMKEYKEMW